MLHFELKNTKKEITKVCFNKKTAETLSQVVTERLLVENLVQQ